MRLFLNEPRTFRPDPKVRHREHVAAGRTQLRLQKEGATPLSQRLPTMLSQLASDILFVTHVSAIGADHVGMQVETAEWEVFRLVTEEARPLLDRVRVPITSVSR